MTRRGRARATAVPVVLAAVLLCGLGREVQPALARMGDVETVVATFATETLDPPTNVNATASLGLVVNITWTATVDLRATGYRVMRGTVNGGPYALVGTVTSRTTTGFTDLPLVPGTYYYVVRTYFGSWTSANSNQDSVFAL
jgi:hypothetical protein